MYDKNYAKQWITNIESGKDIYRRDFLEPYVKKICENISANTTFLDVGCGWGMLLTFLKSGQRYVGVDPTEEFFSYINNRYINKNIALRVGSLPSNIPISGQYDIVFCSMTLHCVQDISLSIETLVSYVKKGGRLVLIDFNDKCLSVMRNDVFEKIKIDESNHLAGIGTLPSGVQVDMEVFFHSENNIEKILSVHGTYHKEYVGPYFVAYDICRV